jgi:hypothetical protein
MAKIKVLEVDQWTSTGNIRNFGLSNFSLSQVKGGDSEAARAIFGGWAEVLDVEETANPSLGRVWFVEKDGKLEHYKANYDTSD